jgi:hypothetical protein
VDVPQDVALASVLVRDSTGSRQGWILAEVNDGVVSFVGDIIFPDEP